MNLNKAGRKSSRAAALAITALVIGSGVSTGVAGAGVYTEDYPAPNTTITAKPAKKTKSTKATFRFVSDISSTSFKCKVDKAAWKKCKSPFKVSGLKSGKHTIKVLGSAYGKTEKSAASFTWTVKK